MPNISTRNFVFLPSYVDVSMDRMKYAYLFKESKVSSRLDYLVGENEIILTNPLYWFQLAEVNCINKVTQEETTYKLPFYYQFIPMFNDYFPADSISEDVVIDNINTLTRMIAETIHSVMLSPCMIKKKFVHYYLHPELPFLSQLRSQLIKSVKMCKESAAFCMKIDIKNIILNSIKWYENTLNNSTYHVTPHNLLLVIIQKYMDFFIIEMRSELPNSIKAIINKYEIINVKIPDYSNFLQIFSITGI